MKMTRNTTIRTIWRAPLMIAVAGFALSYGASGAQAACSNPAGVEGEQIYNTTHNVMQYCDDTDWTAMRGDGDTLSSLSCTDGQVAKWNNTGSVWECAADATGSGGDDLGAGGTTTGTLYTSDGNIGLDATDRITFADNARMEFDVNGIEEMRLTSIFLDLNGNRIADVADPTALQDAATKKYVDNNDADTLANLSCSAGQVAKFDGTNWVCDYSTSCGVDIGSGVLTTQIAPSETEVFYTITGGGGGKGSGFALGGTGGTTHILVNGVSVASASGGGSNANGATSSGTLTLNASDTIAVYVGGGGGGGGNTGTNTSGVDHNGRSWGATWNGTGAQGNGYGGPGDYGGGGGGGHSSNTSRDGGGIGQDGVDRIGGGDGGTGFNNSSNGLAGATIHSGGSAGAASLTYNSSGCWL